jgi:Ca2+-dependent lipid-binding protein
MSTLYEQDYACWAEIMAEKLQQKHFQDLDIENLVEEIKDLSKRERDKLLSSMRLILHHLLKWDYQPEKRCRSWQITVQRERNNIEFYLEDSPSLKKYLCDEWLKKMYRIKKWIIISGLFGILSMTTMHNWQSIKPPSLLPNHHPALGSGVECGTNCPSFISVCSRSPEA